MYIFKERSAISAYLQSIQEEKSVGFTPTMGALHQGHISLIEQSKKQNDISVCSVFVNPTQFNEKSDFDSYPNVLEKDIELLESIGTEILFAPNVKEMYPAGQENIRHYAIGQLDNVLEGKFRPGHFQGVCYIVDELLQIVKPNALYMGEKDFQQIAVVQKMLELTNSQVQLVPCPTLRESSGLAMSSRNTRLSKKGKETAAAFHSNLQFIKTNKKNKSFDALQNEAFTQLKLEGFTPEYIQLCDAKTLEILTDFDHTKSMRLIAAAFLEDVRLIDNISI